MGLIVRDPALHNMPSGYASFCDLARGGHDARAMGFHGKNGDVSRFAARFRVAKSFEGIALEGYTQETVNGYNALLRVFLVWSAFERFMGLLQVKPETILPRLRAYAPARHIQAIRKHDRSQLWLSFLTERVNPELHKQLNAIRSGTSNNITFVAAAARHIFAHGHLSAHANGAAPSDVDAICNILFTFHMSVMDKEFDGMIRKYKHGLPNKTPGHVR